MLKKINLIIGLLSILFCGNSQIAEAQQITIDGSTATVITKDGDRITIDGGNLSGDGKNLFHSLQDFGLTSQQIAEFMTNPNIQNILTRITGGNPSYINGLIEVTGGNSNLFIMNPAGIIFGNGATLNVPADFTATTSTGIGFTNGIFNAIGTNNYQILTGNPTSFIFNTDNPGSIINTGNLTLSEGKNLNLIGGNVINTGTIATEHGKINIQAVEGTSRVKITPEGSLLSLELDLPTNEQGNTLGFTPQDLPTLLTGGNNNGLTTDNVAIDSTTGNVTVSGVAVPNQTGIAVVSGKLDVSSDSSTGGEITVLGNKVALLDAEIKANGLTDGGEIKIGGDYQGKGTIPNSTLTVVDADTSIQANAGANGDGGEVIIWSDGNTIFNGTIEAKGGTNTGDGGFVEVSGKQNLAFNGQVDTTAVNGNTGTLLLDPENVFITDPIIITIAAPVPGDPEINDGIILKDDGGSGVDFTISASTLEGLAGTTNVQIQANNDILVEDLSDNALTFQSNITTGNATRTSVIFEADADNSGAGDFTMDASDAIVASGRDVTISGVNITVGAIDTSIPTGNNGNAGNIQLDATGNINANGNIIATTNNGNAGSIQFSASNGDINLPNNIQFQSFSGNLDNGSVILTANNITPIGFDSTVDFVVDDQVEINIVGTDPVNVDFDVEIANSLVFPNLDIIIEGTDVEVRRTINTNGANLFINDTGTTNINSTINAGNLETNVGGTTQISGENITTTGNQTYNDNVELASKAGTTTLTGQQVTFNGTINSVVAGQESLVVNANQTTFNGAIGNIQALNNLTTDLNGTTNINGGSVTTAGDQDYNDDVVLNSSNDTTTLTGNDVTFGGTLDSATEETENLTVNANATLFTQAVGSNQALGSLTTDANGTTNINGGIVTTTGEQTYNDEVTVGQDTTFTSTGDENISFNNTLDGRFNVNINTGGTTLLGDEVGGTAPLASLTTDANGTTNISGGSVTTIGTQTYNDEVNVLNESNQFTSTENGNISFNNTLDGNTSLTSNVTINTGGTTLFSDEVGGTNPLESLTTNIGGTVEFNANVTTTGNQTYNDVATVDANTTFTSTQNGNITFNNSLDGGFVVNVNTGGITQFSQVGGIDPLASLITDADGTVIFNDNITTTGVQTYNDPATVAEDITFTSNLSGNITFNNTLDGDFVVEVNTGGITVFANQVGGINPLTSLTTDAVGTVEFNGNVTTTGEQTYNDPATVAQDSVFTSLDSNISFNNTLNGNSDVTVNTGGTTQFGNIVGGTTPLTSLTTDAGGTTQLNGNVTTIQNQTYNDEVNILSSIELTSNQGQLEFQNNVNAGINNLTLTSLTGIEFGDNTTVNGTGNLTIQTSNGDRNIVIGQAILGLNNPFLIDNLSALANGFNSITIGNSNTTNTIRVNEILTVQDPLTLQASDIFVLADINGVDDASISIIGDGNTTTLNADITTQGQPIIIEDNVLLTNDVTLDTTIAGGNSNSAEISVLGSINSSGDNRNLTVDAGNNNFFVTGNIGNIQALNNLLVDANATFLDGSLVITSGRQQFNSNIFPFNNSISFVSGSSFFAQDIIAEEQATDITITASQIETEDIFSEGGNISLTSTEEFIITGDLFSSDGNNGGDINVSSASTITTGQIDSSGSSIGGDVNLNVALNQPNNITVQSIDTSSSEGQAGNIRIATRGNLSVTDTISEDIASIDATGGNDDLSGSIFIDLFPPNGAFGIKDDRRLPFVVGNGGRISPVNGTAGIITNGESTIDPGSYTLTVKEGKITIRLLDNFNPTDIIRPIPTIIPTVGFADVPPLTELKVIDTIVEAQEVLTALEEDTKNEHGEAEKPAIVYLSFTPKGYQPENLDADIAHRELSQTQEFTKVGITNSAFQPTVNIEPQDDDILDILVITAQGEPIRVTVPVTRKEVVENAEKFWIAVSDVFALDDSYKSSASNLYSWIVQPIKPELQKREITNLLFILPADIRFIPVAALYDAQEGKFLVEEYSSGLAPSLNLNKNDYRPVKDLNLLAMGASNFEDPNVVPLPAAGLELPTIKAIWNDEQINNFEPYTNQNFNFNTIQSNVSAKSYGIIHFGTHGEFNPDNSGESYIQLYNSRLGLDDIRQLGLREPLVELMVLSACETAFGNEISELGFAGLAVKAGVKSAMGSVWQVSDTGTLALMSDFYKQLKQEPTKAQALRQAQLNMLYKKVYKAEDGNNIVTPERNISLDQLPEESRQAEDFSHPFYWAPFTMIGNPW